MGDTQFASLLNEVNTISSKLDVATLKQMRITRNKIQHNGILPSKSMADRFFKAAEKMFENLTKEYLEINWQDISLAGLIENKNISNACKKSEELFHEGKYLDASKYLIMSFEVCKMARQASQFGSNMLAKQVDAKILIDEFQRLRPLFEYIDKINEEIEIFKLDLDYIKWRDYRLLLGTLNPFKILYEDANFNKDLKINKEMALFQKETSDDEVLDWYNNNFSFVIESIIRWESAGKESGYAFL